MNPTETLDLPKRAQKVLGHLIERYIETGAPVGSGAIVKAQDINVSAATVRNVMADLERLGLINSPHTSAGRVPTSAGYRVFINAILTAEGDNGEAKLAEQVEKELCGGSDPKQLLTNASTVLSHLSSFASVVTLPNSDCTVFKQIEFLGLNTHRVLAILVTQEGMVENKVLEVERAYSESELVEAANYFNHTYQQRSMFDVKQDLLRAMELDSAEIHRSMQTALKMAQGLFDEDVNQQMLVSGENKLVAHPEFHTHDSMAGILEAFTTKHILHDLVSQSLHSNGVNIFIGRESGYEPLHDCSIVTMPYQKGGKSIGVLAVIGPKRMAYNQVVSLIDVTSKLLSSRLS